jgi:hypothetical protein
MPPWTGYVCSVTCGMEIGKRENSEDLEHHYLMLEGGVIMLREWGQNEQARAIFC